MTPAAPGPARSAPSAPRTVVVPTASSGPVPVEVVARGSGHPFLLLHGGAGSASVQSFADRLALERNARVLVPTHPGFGGTARPATLTSVRELAEVYAGLLEVLDLDDVAVVGNSVGGWIAMEMLLLHPPRVSSSTVVDAVGAEVPGHPVVDFFSLTLPEVAARSYYAPERFRVDPAALSPEAQTVMAGNRAALAVYGGRGPGSMTDPTLLGRLAEVTTPTQVVWGEADRIVDPDYGRALADAIPDARFVLLERTGHLPQVESPDRLLGPVWDFAAQRASRGAGRSADPAAPLTIP